MRAEPGLFEHLDRYPSSLSGPSGDLRPALQILERQQRREQVERLEDERDDLAADGRESRREAPVMSRPAIVTQPEVGVSRALQTSSSVL